jgi:hypothetical protein
MYKTQACSMCSKLIEPSRYSSRRKYCLSCVKSKTYTSKTLYCRMKSNSLRRGIEFHLTYEQYYFLVSRNECSYCKGPLPYRGSGVDRKHFEIGYVFGNCVPCCSKCNDRKGRLETCGFSYERVLQLLSELNRGESHGRNGNPRV